MASAKKTTAAKRTSSPAMARKASSQTADYSESQSGGASALADWFSNPAVRYVASGIATAVLAKVATNMSTRYPQIAQFLREGLDTVEGKLSEFNGGSSQNYSSSQNQDEDYSDSDVAAPRSSSRSRRSSSASLN